jgi:hypothetical protein
MAAARARAEARAVTAVVSRAIDIADGARVLLLRRVCASRALRAIAIDRRRRLILMEVGAVALAAALALWAPLVSLWLGAALFGVPHVVAGVRAVAVRRRCSRAALACAGAAVVVGASQLLGAGDAALRAFIVLIALALAGEIVDARRNRWLAALAVAGLLAVALAALASPRLTLVLLAHLHGLASLVYFAICARRRRLPVWPLAVGVVTLVVLAASGGLDGAMAATLWAPRAAGRSIVAEAVGAGFPRASAPFFHRALFLYAFGQSLHFAAWLRLLPEVDRPHASPKPLRRALLDLRADFGRWTVAIAVLTAAAGVAILCGGGAAREAYFALTYFHVGLEGAALLRLGLTRRRAASPILAVRPRARVGDRSTGAPLGVEAA